MHEPQTYVDRLTDAIYGALLGEIDWQVFLQCLAEELPDGKGMMVCYDRATTTGAMNLCHGLDASDIKRFSAHYSKVNPWLPKAMIRPVGWGCVSEQMLPEDEFHRTEFYNDFLRPIDTHAAIGMTIHREDGYLLQLTGFTSRADSETNLQPAGVLTAIAPHLRRAFSFYRSNAVRDAIGDAGASILDAQQVGTVILGDGAVPMQVSKSACAMVEEGSVVTIARGRLRLRDEFADGVMLSMCSRHPPAGKTASFIICDSRVTLTLLKKDSGRAFFQGPTVIVLIEPLFKAPIDFDISHIRRAFDLTRAEASVMKLLLEGRSAEEMSAVRGVQIETIRSQTKSIYAKMGVAGKAEIIAKIRMIGLRKTDPY